VAYRPAEWATVTSRTAGALHPIEVCRVVQQVLDRERDGVLVMDGGEFGQWARACMSARRTLTNGPAGAIGGALPFAAAARLASPASTVVAMLGDGTFGFHPAELDTAARYDLPFVAVVGNDARWNAEHQIQIRTYGRERAHGCDLLPTRYDQVAEGFGAHGEHVTRAADLPAALQRALHARRPACVNVEIESIAAPNLTLKP
jgi:acetolactate synthase I/II/III large subunit